MPRDREAPEPSKGGEAFSIASRRKAVRERALLKRDWECRDGKWFPSDCYDPDFEGFTREYAAKWDLERNKWAEAIDKAKGKV